MQGRLLLPALLVLAGCGSDFTPLGPPEILRFEADAGAVAPGELVPLRWEVASATRVTITTRAGALLVGASPDPSGVAVAGPLLEDTTFVLRAEGPGGAAAASVQVRVVFPAPSVELFAAVPDAIVEGELTRLVWSTTEGEQVRIVDDAGALIYGGAATSSSLTVAPPVDTTYRLAVTGLGGTATATAAVTVRGAPPIIEAFSAEPSRLFEGDPCVLSWRVRGADRVLVADEDGVTLVSTSSASSSLIVRPAVSTQYILLARNPEADAIARVDVTVEVLGPPRIEGLRAVPEIAPLGGTTTLSWRMQSVERYRIFADGQLVLDQAAIGGVANEPVTVTSTRTVFTVEVDNRVGFDEAEVVVFGHRAPLVARFTVTPTLLSAPGAVDVAWRVQSVSELDLLIDGAPAPGFTPVASPEPRDVQGSLTLPVETLAHLELAARSAGGAHTEEDLVVVGVEEVEPNDRVELAQVLTGTAGRVRAGLFAAVDADVYAIDVPPESRIRARVLTGAGRCALDARLTLTSTDGRTIRAMDDDDGVGPCPEIDPARDPGAADLAAGRYYLAVQAATATAAGRYALEYEAGPPACGDGRREGAEQCDDGNLVGGDGCNASCIAEVSQFVGAPGALVSSEHPGGGGAVFVAVDVDRPGQRILAEAASGGPGQCDLVDTAITLFDPDFAALGRTTGGGPVGAAGACAALAVPPDAFAGDLAPGRYALRVDSEGGQAGAVELTVAVADPRCGNGLVEYRAGEQCDDGNQIGGDGCAASCVIERVMPEVEPNDLQALATPTGLSGPGEVIIEGANDPSGDDDVFAFFVPATSTVSLTARTFTTRGAPLSCDSQRTDTRLFLEAAGTPATRPGSGELDFADDIDNPGNVWCSELAGIPLPGGPSGATYYLRVQGWRDFQTTQYFLRLALTR